MDILKEVPHFYRSIRMVREYVDSLLAMQEEDPTTFQNDDKRMLEAVDISLASYQMMTAKEGTWLAEQITNTMYDLLGEAKDNLADDTIFRDLESYSNTLKTVAMLTDPVDSPQVSA